ncbi:MAG: hypothetical protein AB8B48_19705 [Pseudomonadales bacterium]
MSVTTPLKRALLLSVCFAMLACSGSNGSGFAPVAPEQPLDTSPYELIPLELDFTFDLNQQGLDAGELTGLAIVPSSGERFILNREGQLFHLGPFGNFLNQTTIDAGMEETYSGLEWLSEDQIYIASGDVGIYGFNLSTEDAELFAAMPDDFGELENVAYDNASNQVFAINSTGEKQLVIVDNEGGQTVTELDSQLMEYPITGMHAFDGSLFLASTGHSNTPEQAAVIELDYDGVFQSAWSLPEGSPTALLIENRDPLELAIATSDSTSLLFFEAPAPNSGVTGDALTFLAYEELDFDQPSGVDYAAGRNSLIFITDFAEVHELTDGEESIELFELEEAQGSFEALAYSADEIHLLMSDESTPEPLIQRYDLNGTLLTETELEASVDAGTVFEAMDLGEQSQTLYLLSGNDDEQKLLVRITDSGQTVSELPEAFDDMTIVGVDISADETQAIFVTDERVEDDARLSGLAISIDLNTLEERWRLAIAVPGEDEDLIGLAAPSGIAVDRARSRLYISSDVDDSMLAVFELPEEQ